MCASEREIAEIMIEGRRSPAENRMALPARVRVVARDVIRIRYSFKIVLMATKALRRRAIKLSIDVTRCAINGNVCTEQGESRAVMIESRRLPSRCVMTLSAVVRELGFDVIVSVLIVRLVTGPAVGGRASVLSVGMALRTTHRDMCSGEREIA